MAHVDMSNKLQSCPGNPLDASCASAKFSTHGKSYTKVYMVGSL